MITKEYIIKLYCKYNSNNAPKKYKPLFSTNGFQRFMYGRVLTNAERNEVIKYTHSMYHGNSDLSHKQWDRDLIVRLIKSYITNQLINIGIFYDDYEYRSIIEGLICVLEDDIPHKYFEEYSRFYNDTAYGFFNMPRYLDIIDFYKLDLKENLASITGFIKEDECELFDLNEWKNLFKKSNQITMLKNEYSKDWSITDFSFDKNGEYDSRLNSRNGIYNRETNKYEPSPTPHYGLDYTMFLIRSAIPGCNHLRVVDTGSSYLSDLIRKKGFINGWIDTHPIIKLNIVQGFAFYYYSSHVFCDDMRIKKIIFNTAKPQNLELEKEPRIFIIHNKKTGYWQLPELHYPIKYKGYIKDIIKQQKDLIGKWTETCVFANSRTLCGDTYSFDLSNYPDIKSKDTFIETIINNCLTSAYKYLTKINSNWSISNLGLNVNITYNKDSFDFNNSVKLLDCITQDDINNYVNPNSSLLSYNIEYYE